MIDWRKLWEDLENWREQEATKRTSMISFIEVRQKIQELVEKQLGENK